MGQIIEQQHQLVARESTLHMMHSSSMPHQDQEIRYFPKSARNERRSQSLKPCRNVPLPCLR